MKIRRLGAIWLAVIIVGASAPAFAGQPSVFDQLGSDFKYTLNNGTADIQDIFTAPFKFQLEYLARPKVYFTILGAGAALGTAFALDNTLRSHIRGISSSDADAMQTAGTYSLAAGAGLIYLAGLINDNDRARQYMLTTTEGLGVAEIITIMFKYGFGRLRPRQGHGSTAFFDGGQSFVSGETTPVFALAAGISEYYDYQWYIALPCYSAAVAVGLGRMGNDAHWFSDVVGSGLLGVGTTTLLLYLHKKHAEDPNRHYWIIPIATPSGGGVGAGYDW
jgi:membrane-associated phospholipid phosphatase